MNKKLTDTVALLGLALSVLVLPGPARAQDAGDPIEGAIFLLLPVGAQGVALGRAMTWVDGVESVWWNPAGLAGLTRSQLVVVRGDHAVGTATAATLLYAREGRGSVAASYYLLDAGEFDQTDDFGNYTGKLTVRNHLGIVSAATHLTDRVEAGINFKIVRFQFTCRGICNDDGTTATTYAVDLGTQIEPVTNLRVGALVAHLGPRLQVRNAEQADPLPARVRMAAAYDVVSALLRRESLQGWIALEMEDRLRSFGATSVYLGTELRAGRTDALSLRAGHAWSQVAQEDGTRVGLGLRYQRFDLAIAKSLAVSTITGETEPVHVTFSIGF
jgi:hypothetical protein